MNRTHFKKFLSYYRPYLGLFLADMICALIYTAISLAFPLFTRYIIQNVLERNMVNAMTGLYRIGGILVGLLAIQVCCEVFVDYRGHSMGAMMERDMRMELFQHLQKMSFRFYDDNRIGQLMSRITNDLLSLAEFYHHFPEDIILNFIKFIGAFVILLTINVRLTLMVFAFLPVMAVYAFHFNKKLKVTYKESYERIGEIDAQVEDTLSGIRVVQSFTNEDTEVNKFADANERFLNSRKSIYRGETCSYQGVDTLKQLITITLIIFGGAGILHSSLSIADLVTFLMYISYLIGPVQELANATTRYQAGISGFERFMEIMELEPEIRDKEDAIEVTKVKGNIEFNRVGFRYGDSLAYVLKDISLNIKAGEYVALAGTSGVGKTTLCSLISRFYDVTEGEITLDGRNIKEITLKSLRGNIGVVQQDVYLFAGTILENIRYGSPEAGRAEIIEAATKANAHDFIMELPNQYETDIGQRGVKLSGGQKQRISIARVFLKNPPILILDEATSALDNESEKVIQDSLEMLAKNRTTIVIAHRLTTIRNADRILLLEDGEVKEQGSHEALMRQNGSYAHLYQA